MLKNLPVMERAFFRLWITLLLTDVWGVSSSFPWNMYMKMRIRVASVSHRRIVRTISKYVAVSKGSSTLLRFQQYLSLLL